MLDPFLDFRGLQIELATRLSDRRLALQSLQNQPRLSAELRSDLVYEG